MDEDEVGLKRPEIDRAREARAGYDAFPLAVRGRDLNASFYAAVRAPARVIDGFVLYPSGVRAKVVGSFTTFDLVRGRE